MSLSPPVRVRFAPSPTGYLHVGGARTALYNYLFAKRYGGKFILRVEDTDTERSSEEFIRMQLADLKWLGLDWDEGPDFETLKDSGEYGPYRQSQRQDIYKKYAEKLIESGQAYYCFLTDAEIDEQRQRAQREGRPPHVDSPYRDWTLEKAKERMSNGETAVVRFKVGEKKDYTFKDLVRGEVVFPSDMVGDFVLLRSSGMPVYNFCCAIDDALMKITHVFRAEEHLSNTLRQMMIYETLGFTLPEFGHMSIILGSDKQKLSKRHGATSCNEYKERGFLPEALLNFVALLGWSSPDGEEVMSVDQLTSKFAVDRLNSSPAVFDEAKLLWMNATHLRALPNAKIFERLKPYLDAQGLKFTGGPEWQNQAIETFKSSMQTLQDGVGLFTHLSETPIQMTDEGREALAWPTSRKVLEVWKAGLENLPGEFLTEAEFMELQNTVKEKAEVKGKQLFQPIRVAVIGSPHGTELKLLIPLLQKHILIDRAEQALANMSSQ